MSAPYPQLIILLVIAALGFFFGRKLFAPKPPGATTPAPGTVSLPARLPPPRAQGELILVVDDETGVRELLQAVLVNHGYEVLTAGNSVEGLRLFASRPADVTLVITDMHMPYGSGDSFAAQLRASRPTVRILYMSGLGAEEAGHVPAPTDGSDPFLLKPFKPTVLLEAVHKLLHPVAP